MRKNKPIKKGATSSKVFPNQPEEKSSSLLQIAKTFVKLPYDYSALTLLLFLILTGGVAAIVLLRNNNNNNSANKLGTNSFTLFKDIKTSCSNFSVIEGNINTAKNFLVAEHDHTYNKPAVSCAESIARALGTKHTILVEGASGEVNCERFGFKSLKGRKCIGWEPESGLELDAHKYNIEKYSEIIKDLDTLIKLGSSAQNIDEQVINRIKDLEKRIQTVQENPELVPYIKERAVVTGTQLLTALNDIRHLRREGRSYPEVYKALVAKVKTMDNVKDDNQSDFSVKNRNIHMLKQIKEQSKDGGATITLTGNGHLLLTAQNPELESAQYLRNELRRGANCNPYAILASLPDGFEEDKSSKLRR